MTKQEMPYPKFNYDEHARTRPLDDFWGQVRRTVGGGVVSDDQIKMIVDVIRLALDLKPGDMLLEIACGNGALSHLLFDSCSGYLGSDVSEHLISVAKTNFEALPNYQFMQQDATEFVRSESRPEKFSKALCYASFQYFPVADAAEVLRTLLEKFSNVQTIFIGNLPDKDRAAEFYKRPPNIAELADCYSQIGIWRTRSEFAKMANEAGWQVKFSTMPAGFYAAHYRYDALLSR